MSSLENARRVCLWSHSIRIQLVSICQDTQGRNRWGIEGWDVVGSGEKLMFSLSLKIRRERNSGRPESWGPADWTRLFAGLGLLANGLFSMQTKKLRLRGLPYDHTANIDSQDLNQGQPDYEGPLWRKPENMYWIKPGKAEVVLHRKAFHVQSEGRWACSTQQQRPQTQWRVRKWKPERKKYTERGQWTLTALTQKFI